jgi:hypothetical protein
MMKKLILLCLLIIGMLLVGCTTENIAEDEMQDITEEDLAELPEEAEIGEEDGALVGNAKWFNCEDGDSTTTYDKNSLATIGTTTYDGGSFTDRCYTWYKGTPNEKTRLIEGMCYNGKFRYWYNYCSKLGADYECVNENPNGGWGNQGQEGHCVLATTEPECVNASDCESTTENYCNDDFEYCQSVTLYDCVNGECSSYGGGGSCSDCPNGGICSGTSCKDVVQLDCNENTVVKEKEYFTFNGEDFFRYKGSDKLGDTNPKAQIQVLNLGETFERSITGPTDLGYAQFDFNYEGENYQFWSASDPYEDDFDIQYVCEAEESMGCDTDLYEVEQWENGTFVFNSNTYIVYFQDYVSQPYAGGINQADFSVNGETFSLNVGESEKLVSGDYLVMEGLSPGYNNVSADVEFCFSDGIN